MERAEREAAALAQHQEISKRAAGVARALFARQRKVVLAKLAGQKARKGTRHWRTPTGRPPVVTKVIAAEDVFDANRWDDEWAADMGSVYDDVYTQVSPDVARALEDSDYDPSAPAVAAAIATLVKLHSTASARANATTAAQIQAAIAQVEQTGASMDALSAAVGGVFDTAEGSRADTVGDYVATGALGGAAVLGAAWAAGVASGSPPDEAVSVDDSGNIQSGPGGSPGSGIQKSWLTMQDERVRPWHADADGQTVPIDQPFSVNDEDMMYPGDPAGSPENTINCFPAGTLVDSPGTELAYRRWYDGPMVTVRSRQGHHLSGTPNHPVMTDRGWVPLGQIDVGDHLIRGALRQDGVAGDPDVADAPALIDEVFRSLAQTGDQERHVGREADFHGDGRKSQVDVVGADGELRNRALTTGLEPGSELALARADLPVEQGVSLRPPGGPQTDGPGTIGATTPSRVRGGGPGIALLAGHGRHRDPIGLGSAADGNAPGLQPAGQGWARHAQTVCQRLETLAAFIALDEVVDVKVDSFAGHVFNLQTVTGWYMANGVLSGNCRCTLVFSQAGQEVGTTDTGEAPEDVGAPASVQAGLRPYRMDRKLGVVLKDATWGGTGSDASPAADRARAAGDWHSAGLSLAEAPYPTDEELYRHLVTVHSHEGMDRSEFPTDLDELDQFHAEDHDLGVGAHQRSKWILPTAKAADQGTRDYRDDDFHVPQDAICLACRSKVTPTAAGACPRCASAQLLALEGPNSEDQIGQYDEDHIGHQSSTPAVTHVPDIKRAKLSKDSVDYRAGSDEQHCGNCSMYRILPPDFESAHCTLVAGLIDAAMVCDRWDGGTKRYLTVAEARAAAREKITVAGLVVRARDTGRILMIQRSQNDPDDPAAGTWEWPGGHLEPGEAPIQGAKREWSEETGCALPAGEVVANWISGDGIYEGFVFEIPAQADLDINADHEDRSVLNPDDPDGDDIEVAAWWDPQDLPGMPALRSECRLAPWPIITGPPMAGLKGDAAGHAFHGNQYTGGIGGGVTDARTGLPRTSFVDPATGQPMTRTQIGGVGEQLFLRAAGPDLADKLGGPLQHISEGANRRAPLDFMADHLTGIEVKTLSSEAQNQKTAISAEEKERKYAEAERLGLKQTATVLQVLDLQAGTMKVAYSDGIVSKSFATMTPLGTYDVTQHLADLGFKRVHQLDLAEKIRYQTCLAKGDAPGHAFRGNQYTGGIGGGASQEEHLARQMTERSAAIEPVVTGHMSEVVGKAGGEMLGLKYALKSEDSLSRKIGTDALAERLTANQAAGKISDSLRYTMGFDGAKYTEGTRSAIADLQERGYSLEKLKNTWEPATNPYRGINTQWTTPDGDKFELQFHTPESFDMKESVNHGPYEEARLPTTSDERAAELRQIMGENSSTLTMPGGAETIGSRL